MTCHKYRLIHCLLSPVAAAPLILAFTLSLTAPVFCSEVNDAARNGDLVEVTALLKGNPELTLSKDREGLTPLHEAAAYGHKDIVELLLVNKAEVDARAVDGSTPLHAASAHGHRDIAGLLLANKAYVDARTNGGLTPLHLAALLDHRDVAILLLANQADVNSKSSAGVSAGLEPGKHVVHALSGAGFPTEHSVTYGSGTTPLHLAALLGRKELVKILLAHGADVNEKTSSGKTPLQLAKGHKDVEELLRQHGGR